ncbi:DASH complex subunit Hsk3 like-domain-containing protein [Aspergillus oleicola]
MPPTYRPSILPPSTSTTYAGNASSMSSTKTRQYAQLQSQLAQLNVNLSNTEEIVQMTAHQAKDMRFLGGYVGALFMGSAKVLGEEGVKGSEGNGGKEEEK